MDQSLSDWARRAPDRSLAHKKLQEAQLTGPRSGTGPKGGKQELAVILPLTQDESGTQAAQLIGA